MYLKKYINKYYIKNNLNFIFYLKNYLIKWKKIIKYISKTIMITIMLIQMNKKNYKNLNHFCNKLIPAKQKRIFILYNFNHHMYTLKDLYLGNIIFGIDHMRLLHNCHQHSLLQLEILFLFLIIFICINHHKIFQYKI